MSAACCHLPAVTTAYHRNVKKSNKCSINKFVIERSEGAFPPTTEVTGVLAPNLMKLTTKQLTLCAVLTAMALALSYVENFFPLSLAIPIPGIKLGLANIVTVFALYVLGPVQAILILLARCLLGAVFAGNMSALIFSLLGGVTAMLVMILLSRWKKLSIYGVSMGGAAAHNCGQVAAAILTLGNTAPLYYLPILLGVSLFTGALTGLIAACLFQALSHTDLVKG